ncbi:hypothetical protein AB0C42_29435 [Micromonospora taraxaci]|uniref:hypothetical protein n=1 Tax=Micromonospora TaxID=1873 RepID=UPI002417DA2C|nr:hypothetical protein [Micromonospora sp. WMMD967]MDG4838192.1 hypothetical protein [Micromonospora sp. WMMD967]
MKLKPALVAVPVALALGLGIGAAPSAISAAPAASSVNVGTAQGATTEQLGAAARAIIAAVTKLGSGAVNAMRAAVASYQKFQAWWKTLPWYIRVLGSGLNLYSLYEAIRDLL